MSEFDAHAAIVYPVNWPVHEEAHCTIMYLGEVADLNYNADDVIRVLRQFAWQKRLIVATSGIEMFGPNHDIPVLVLANSALTKNRQYVVAALKSEGIYDASSFKDSYRSHITIPEEIWETDIKVPGRVELGVPQVWWGTDKLPI